MHYAKTLKLQIRVGDLGLPERRGIPVPRSREEEEDAQMCPCVATQKKVETRESGVACEMYKDERDGLEEETRKTDACDEEKFSTTATSDRSPRKEIR